jgi:hypothetical protein
MATRFCSGAWTHRAVGKDAAGLSYMWARMFVRFICIICFLLILLVVMDLLMLLFDMPWPVVLGAMVCRPVLSPIWAFAAVTAKTPMVAAANIGR